jgi:hypothetical protein
MSIAERFSNLLFSVTDAGREIKTQRDRLILLIVRVRDQYVKFGVLSPSVEQEVDTAIDDVRGGLPRGARESLKKMLDYVMDQHLLPPADYKNLVEDNDILRSANEILVLSNTNLRHSNDRLQSLVEKMQAEKFASPQPEIKPEEAPSV